MGCSFEQLDAMLQAAGETRLGICLDTQHMFAAGIDWTTPRGYDAAFTAFERCVGLRHLEAFHLNDSKKPLGSRVDRHAVIGDELIGLRPFARLVRDPRFTRLCPATSRRRRSRTAKIATPCAFASALAALARCANREICPARNAHNLRCIAASLAL